VSEVNIRFSSFLTALYVGLTSSLIYFLIDLFQFDYRLDALQLKSYLISFVLVWLFSYVLLYLTIERFIIKRANEIYRTFFPTSLSSHAPEEDSDIDFLTDKLKKFASDSKGEIETLKKQENYRREFIGNLSHELKTPLFTIQGYVLTLLDGDIEDSKIIRKYLKRTAKGVERLEFIIKDLDLITKFESGIAKLDYIKFDIREILTNVFELLEMQAIKNNITLKMDDYYEKPIYVYADPERIQQVITNLIINSLKYGVDQGVTEVSLSEFKENKILVRIIDNGEGIDKEHLPRLFERFYRVDKTRNRNQGGSGLGLAIVKHIIEAHNEQIFVESEVKVGSEFSFSLSRA
jgi:two-component system phosphate regulon sensor histidine kinase PhoR